MGLEQGTTRHYHRTSLSYGKYRRPDPHLAAVIQEALGDARSVVNVGAGTGSYEPTDRTVVAVEPSTAMIGQRPEGSAPIVQASASELPFGDGTFDAALAILTVHHWPDRARGLNELSRVTRDRVVAVTWDPATSGFWLLDYFPEIGHLDRRLFPSVEEFGTARGRIEVRPLMIPHDCTDGFLGAYWRRPHAYLDAGVRSAMSAFSRIADVEPGLTRLRTDLEDGTWSRRYERLLELSELDVGYRLVTARRASWNSNTKPDSRHEV